MSAITRKAEVVRPPQPAPSQLYKRQECTDLMEMLPQLTCRRCPWWTGVLHRPGRPVPGRSASAAAARRTRPASLRSVPAKSTNLPL